MVTGLLMGKPGYYESQSKQELIKMAVLAAFQSYYMIVSFELEWQVGESRKPAPITIMGRGIAIGIRSETWMILH